MTRFGSRQPDHLHCRAAVPVQHRGQRRRLAHRRTAVARLPGARHARGRGRARRDPLQRLPHHLYRRQHRPGGDPVRRRPAHEGRELPCRAQTCPRAGDRGRGGHRGADRGLRRLGAGPGSGPGVPDRRDRRLDGRGRGVLPLALAWHGAQAPGRRHARDRVGQQRSDGDLPHRGPGGLARARRCAVLEPGLAVRAADGAGRAARPGRRPGPGLAHQSPAARAGAVSSAGPGRRLVRICRHRHARRQRLPGHLRRRTGAWQPAPASGGQHPAGARRHRLAGADHDVPGAGPAGHTLRARQARPGGARPSPWC